MDAALSPRAGDYGENRSSRFGWMALLAAGLVGIMIFTSVWMNGSAPPPPDDGSDLAWAPGMGTVEANSEIASPDASPTTYTYGPEYACRVEPLTADEVVATVLNPANGYNRLGADSDVSRKYEESRFAWPTPYDSSGMVMATEGEEQIAQGAVDTANMFWNCLMTGTAYQVWALTSPDLIQANVLLNLPVVRTEEDIRQYIEEWGPRRYSAGLGLIWMDLGNSDPAMVGVQFHGSVIPSEDGTGGVLVGFGYGPDREISQAIVFLTMPEGQRDQSTLSIQLSLRLHPNGTWTVVGYEVPGGMG